MPDSPNQSAPLVDPPWQGCQPMTLPRDHCVAWRDTGNAHSSRVSYGDHDFVSTSIRFALTVALGIALVISVGITPSSGQSLSGESSEVKTQVDAAGEATQRELVDLRQEIESRVTSLDSALLSLQVSPTNQWLLQSYRLERDQLKYLDIVYAQHQSLLEAMAHIDDEDAAIAAELRQFRDQRLIGDLDASFTEFDSLRDAIDKNHARVRTFRAELSSGEAVAEVVSDRLDEEERHRRALTEMIENSDDPVATKKLERERVTTELSSQISWANLNKQLLENEYRQNRLEATKLHLKTLEEVLETVRPHVTFSDDDLSHFLSQLRRKENNLRSQLAGIQSQLASLNGEPMRQAANHESLSSIQRAVVLESIKQMRKKLQMRMSYINATLSELVVMQHCWEVRQDVFHDRADEEQLTSTLEITSTYMARMESVRELTNLQLDEARGHHDALADRIEEERTRQSPLVPWLEMHFQALEALFDGGNARLAHIQHAESFFVCLEQEIQVDITADTTSVSWLTSLGSLQGWWSREIFAVDDNPITLGKLVSAIAMLIVGLFLSKRLSRTVGCRMLPRLGMHEGASLATQTIVFYALTLVCLLFTLEMLSIPLTVFTFLAGAAAITVGFGSQTLLNNFMSGLIILGEQPVRVGDLVEIDGVQGNISHIGARSTKIKTGANVEIIVPNSKFMEQHLTNWTLSNAEIRTQVNVGVAYGSPTDQVFHLLSRSLEENESVLKTPEPIILFAEFGNDTLQFELHFWIEMQTVMQGKRIESDVRRRIDQLFREHDITIAFPQRDVHLDLHRLIEVNLNKQLSSRMTQRAA